MYFFAWICSVLCWFQAFTMPCWRTWPCWTLNLLAVLAGHSFADSIAEELRALQLHDVMPRMQAKKAIFNLHLWWPVCQRLLQQRLHSSGFPTFHPSMLMLSCLLHQSSRRSLTNCSLGLNRSVYARACSWSAVTWTFIRWAQQLMHDETNWAAPVVWLHSTCGRANPQGRSLLWSCRYMAWDCSHWRTCRWSTVWPCTYHCYTVYVDDVQKLAQFVTDRVRERSDGIQIV